MRLRFLFLLVILVRVSSSTQAQTYYAGTPVYDVLVTQQTNIAYVAPNCVTRKIFFDSQFCLAPTGTTVYFKITSSTLPVGSIYLVNHGVLNAGDSVLAPVNNAYLEFYATSGSGDFVYNFIRTGVPTQVNDSFFCSSQIDYSFAWTVDGCSIVNTDLFYPNASAPSCVVNGPLGQTEIANTEIEWHVFPNPVLGELCSVSPVKAMDVYTLELFNASGQFVFSERLQTEKYFLNTSAYDAGFYHVRLQSADGRTWHKTISIVN